MREYEAVHVLYDVLYQALASPAGEQTANALLQDVCIRRPARLAPVRQTGSEAFSVMMAVVKQTTGIGIVYMCGLMPHASLPGEQLPSASIIYLSPGVRVCNSIRRCTSSSKVDRCVTVFAGTP